MIKFNSNTVSKWYDGTINAKKAYHGDKVMFLEYLNTSPTPQYRTTSGETYCSGTTGFDKYVDIYSQVSYDGGVTWTTTATTPTLLEQNSEDCGYVPYTALTYIERDSGHTGNIDLGLDVAVDFKVEMQIIPTRLNGGFIIGDNTTSYDQNDFRFFGSSTKGYFDLGSNRINNPSINTFKTGTTYTVTLENYKFTLVSIEGTVPRNGTAQTASVVEQFHWSLFGGASSSDYTKVYYVKIWNGSTLVGDFIPVLTTNNVYTMYNKVTNTFCTTSGSLTGS